MQQDRAAAATRVIDRMVACYENGWSSKTISTAGSSLTKESATEREEPPGVPRQRPKLGLLMRDCLIIGGGPAGLTAAIYLARYRRAAVLVDDGASRTALIPLSAWIGK
jgi:NADPH-dependent 2,4-dienoyl-CoA reductase/sulfur reductase-like enzyme